MAPVRAMRVRRPASRWLLGATIALASTVGCDAGKPSATGTPSAPATGVATPGPSLAPRGTPPFPTDGNGFDPDRFGEDSAVVDNRYFPLIPGTQMTYEGSSIGDEGERIEHRVVFTVTGLSKEIAGVRTAVGWDRDFEEGELVEKELIFFAQDVEGNVWHLGQYAEIYDGEQFEGAAPWLVGYVEGAMAGLAMPAEHAEGDPEYSQGYAPPPYFWDDYGRVFRTGERTCVPVDCYDDVLVIEEFEPTKPGAFQLKFYAPDVGYVRVGWRGAKEREREVLVLTGIRRLEAGELEAVHADAFAMESRAIVYGLTSPLEPAA
jgi:hypothetical protein